MKFPFALMLLVAVNTFGQTASVDSAKWIPPYHLPHMESWGEEQFPIPIEFAPSIPYKGIEDLRFAPGWADVKSNEYWTYAFLWYLEGSVEMNAGILEQHVQAYYTGLVGRNIERRKIPSEKLFPMKTTFKKIESHTGDMQTWSGTIHMLDYMDQKPMTLNCVVHQKQCNEPGRTFVFFQISPKPVTDDVWKTLRTLWTEFKCTK